MIFHAGNFHNVLHYILNRINLKEVVNVLRYASESFKAHTGIYIGMRKTRVIVVTVIFELSEYEVPKFDITVALTAYLAVGLAAAVLFAAVIIYFRARSARTAPCSQKLSSLPKRTMCDGSTPISLVHIS